MPDSNLQQGRNEARDHNQDILLDIGFRRIRNSSLFTRAEGTSVLSPGISGGKHQKYWFDVREANLSKIDRHKNAWVLLRIVPDQFALFRIERIKEHLHDGTREERNHSGVVYGFYCVLDKSKHQITIAPKSGRSSSFVAELMGRLEAERALAAAMSS